MGPGYLQDLVLGMGVTDPEWAKSNIPDPCVSAVFSLRFLARL